MVNSDRVRRREEIKRKKEKSEEKRKEAGKELLERIKEAFKV